MVRVSVSVFECVFNALVFQLQVHTDYKTSAILQSAEDIQNLEDVIQAPQLPDRPVQMCLFRVHAGSFSRLYLVVPQDFSHRRGTTRSIQS